VAPRDFRSRLVRRASKAGVRLTDELSAGLIAYYELLARWNRKINLTGLTDPDEAIDRLLLEPLVAARYLPSPTAQLMDIGSGGGSPAIPLKLAAPDLALTMVEVKARKSAFLREAIRELELDSTQVENARYEELLTRPELHDKHDAVSIRAVRVEPRALVTLQAFLRPRGTIMLFRGPDGSAESPSFYPPLELVQTVPLLDATQSRLTVLAKRPVGGRTPVISSRVLGF
jgi:16S rRNA (guanine527-N7)-methyltransferase